MYIVKIGGPVYRIGVGGGSASSIQIQGDNASELDFGAVQRGDAEMEQKLNRAIRACIEMKELNPVCSIHDQGAGGNGMLVVLHVLLFIYLFIYLFISLHLTAPVYCDYFTNYTGCLKRIFSNLC